MHSAYSLFHLKEEYKLAIRTHDKQPLPNFPIKTVSNVKYLGVYLDNELNFKEHIKLLESKVARSIGIMCKLQQMFPEKNLASTLQCTYPSDPNVWNNYFWGYLSLLPQKTKSVAK